MDNIAQLMLAYPLSVWWGRPNLAYLIPVAGLAAFASGFNSTRLDTAARHLALGRLTVLQLVSQLLAALITVGMAWWLRSVSP